MYYIFHMEPELPVRRGSQSKLCVHRALHILPLQRCRQLMSTLDGGERKRWDMILYLALSRPQRKP